MANLVRWEPMRDLMSLRDEMDRMVEERFFRPLATMAPWAEASMAVDMYDTEDTVVVKTVLPGVKSEDIEISVAGDTVTIKAEVKEEKEIKRESFLRRERRYGSCCRSVTLPGGLDTAKAEADYSDGILTLTFPKAEEVKPKTIKVKTAE